MKVWARFRPAVVEVLHNAWVVLNANAQEPITTFAMKLNYIWHSITLHQMEIEASPG